jgi:hypothetical protein
MLNIDHLRLQLPAGFEHRAASIARLVTDRLAHTRFKKSRRIDHLTIHPVRIGNNASDNEIAHQIARGITTKIKGDV